MRKKHFVILVAVLCFITSFFVLGAKAKSGVRVKRVPKSKLSLFMKAVGNFVYDAKLNRWEMSESYVDSNTKKHPVVLKAVLIGEQKVPAYYEPGNLMADPCDHGYIIITDQSYAIVISNNCGAVDELDRYVKAYSLPKGVNAIRAKEEAGWEVIDQ